MKNSGLSQHISQQFNQELEYIRSLVLNMGGLVEEQLADGLKALVEGDVELAQKVLERDVEVNTMEVRIDEECTLVLARRQPAAGDLRLVIAVIKTITDLERIGDEVKRIANGALNTDAHQPLESQLASIGLFGEQVAQMLHRALDAFARMDVELSVAVSLDDRKIDVEYENLMRQQITHMMEDPRKIRTSLDMLWAARALERMGDRACNICEYVIYLVKGKDVRHINIEEIEDQLR